MFNNLLTGEAGEETEASIEFVQKVADWAKTNEGIAVLVIAGGVVGAIVLYKMVIKPLLRKRK